MGALIQGRYIVIIDENNLTIVKIKIADSIVDDN